MERHQLNTARQLYSLTCGTMPSQQEAAEKQVPVVMTSLLPPLCIDEGSLKHALRVQRVQAMRTG